MGQIFYYIKNSGYKINHIDGLYSLFSENNRDYFFYLSDITEGELLIKFPDSTIVFPYDIVDFLGKLRKAPVLAEKFNTLDSLAEYLREHYSDYFINKSCISETIEDPDLIELNVTTTVQEKINEFESKKQAWKQLKEDINDFINCIL